MYALVDARQKHGGVYRSDDAGETWQRVNNEERVYGRGADFACVRVDPEKQGRHLRRQHLAPTAPTDARQELHRHQRRARRRRLPHHLDQSRRIPTSSCSRVDQGATISVNGGANVEFLVQPADRAVLSRHHRQPVSLLGLWRAAGERIGRRRQPRRRWRDHLSRMAPGRHRRVRLCRARSAAIPT